MPPYAPSTVSQVVQLAVETTRGTPATTGFRKPKSLSFEVGIEADIKTHRAVGRKFPSMTMLGKEFAAVGMSGLADYNELIIPAHGAFKKVAATQLMDGTTPTGAYRYVYLPSDTEEDDTATFTLEQGNATRARRAAYGLVNSFGMEISRDEVTVTGDMIARRLEVPYTFTAGATELSPEEVPVQPTEMAIFLDSDYTVFSGATPTQLDLPLSAGFTVGDRYATVWPIDRRQPSFGGHVEQAPSLEASLLLPFDAVAEGLLDVMRKGDTRFLRFDGLGPQIYDAADAANDQFYRYQMEMAVQVTGVERFSDEDGVFAVGWTFTMVQNALLGGAFRLVLVNTVPAL